MEFFIFGCNGMAVITKKFCMPILFSCHPRSAKLIETCAWSRTSRCNSTTTITSKWTHMLLFPIRVRYRRSPAIFSPSDIRPLLFVFAPAQCALRRDKCKFTLAGITQIKSSSDWHRGRDEPKWDYGISVPTIWMKISTRRLWKLFIHIQG